MALHRAVDATVRPVEEANRDRLRCAKGCHGCCVDALTVSWVEAARIEAEYPELLAQGTPHPSGKCAMLDAEGACRIYDARPYVCRTQGLPLRWFDARDDELVEHRDICPLNEAGPALEALEPSACFTLGPVETKLAELSAPRRDRIALRSLFRLAAATPTNEPRDADPKR